MKNPCLKHRITGTMAGGVISIYYPPPPHFLYSQSFYKRKHPDTRKKRLKYPKRFQFRMVLNELARAQLLTPIIAQFNDNGTWLDIYNVPAGIGQLNDYVARGYLETGQVRLVNTTAYALYGIPEPITAPTTLKTTLSALPTPAQNDFLGNAFNIFTSTLNAFNPFSTTNAVNTAVNNVAAPLAPAVNNAISSINDALKNPISTIWTTAFNAETQLLNAANTPINQTTTGTYTPSPPAKSNLIPIALLITGAFILTRK